MYIPEFFLIHSVLMDTWIVSSYRLCLVIQLCLTLCDPMDYSLPGSSIHGILQARSGLQCPPPGDLPNPGVKHRSSTLQADALPSEPPEKPHLEIRGSFWHLPGWVPGVLALANPTTLALSAKVPEWLPSVALSSPLNPPLVH